MVEGTVVQGVVLPQQPYAQQPVQPMAVVQAPYGQPMAVPQACCAPYGGATVVPYVPQPMAPQGPTNAAIQRGPGNQTFPATLASHAGQGIVVKSTICCPCGIFLHPMIICPCCASELRLGPASQAKWLKWDDTREHLTLVDACGQHLNVDDEKFEVNKGVSAFCCGGCPPDGKTMSFKYEPSDGTIRPSAAPHLALGVHGIKLVLVSADSADRLVFL